MSSESRDQISQLEQIRKRVESPEFRDPLARDQQLIRMRKQVRAFENRYEISTHEMIANVTTGRMKETREIASWLWTSHLIDQLDAKRQTQLESDS